MDPTVAATIITGVVALMVGLVPAIITAVIAFSTKKTFTPEEMLAYIVVLERERSRLTAELEKCENINNANVS
jgi:hypothetical protein